MRGDSLLNGKHIIKVRPGVSMQYRKSEQAICKVNYITVGLTDIDAFID